MKKNCGEILERFAETGAEPMVLLQCFSAGLPLLNLRPLLESANEQVQRGAIWIVSELGVRSGTLTPLIYKMTAHPVKYVRFYALDAIIANVNETNAEMQIFALSRLFDEDRIVALKCMNLLIILIELGKLPILIHKSGYNLKRVLTELSDILNSIDWREKIYMALDDSSYRSRQIASVVAVSKYSEDSAPLLRVLQENSGFKDFAQEWISRKTWDS